MRVGVEPIDLTGDLKDPESGPPVSFDGAEYRATLPPGWEQQEREKVVRDRSYIANT